MIKTHYVIMCEYSFIGNRTELFYVTFNLKRHMSRVMRKPNFCLGENKGADQLSYTDSTIPPTTYIQNFKIRALFCDCTGRFVSDLVGNSKDRFSRDAAHIIQDVDYLSCAKKNQ